MRLSVADPLPLFATCAPEADELRVVLVVERSELSVFTVERSELSVFVVDRSALSVFVVERSALSL